MTAQVTWMVLCCVCVVPKTVGVGALEQTDVLLCRCIQGHHSSKFKNHWSPDSSLFLVMSGQFSVYTVGPAASSMFNLKITLSRVSIPHCYQFVQTHCSADPHTKSQCAASPCPSQHSSQVHSYCYSLQPCGKEGNIIEDIHRGIHRWKVTLLQLINYFPSPTAKSIELTFTGCTLCSGT